MGDDESEKIILARRAKFVAAASFWRSDRRYCVQCGTLLAPMPLSWPCRICGFDGTVSHPQRPPQPMPCLSPDPSAYPPPPPYVCLSPALPPKKNNDE